MIPHGQATRTRALHVNLTSDIFRIAVQGRRAHRPDVAITEALDVEEGKLPPLKDRSGSLPSHFGQEFSKEKKWYHFGSSKKAAKKRV